MHLNSELIFREYASKYFKDGKVVLEIGPHGFPSYYKKILSEDLEWHTLDIGTEHIAGGHKNPLHVTSASEYNYPIADNTYDIVLSGQVMEHVKKIWLWVDELKRITKPGGLIILIVPVSWTYHAVPVDCWRIYPEGMKALMDEKGLTIVDCRYDSLEKNLIPKTTPTIPGNETIDIHRSVSRKHRSIFAFNRIVSGFFQLHRVALPVTVAYDTICVVRKPEE